MKGKMQGVTLVADWDPNLDFELGAKDIDGRQTYLGSLVYRNPRIEIREYDIPTPGPDEVLLQVKACGICGSDVHMAPADHELSGIVVEAGKNTRDKRTNKPYKGGERVTTEEMLWCAYCKPCANGYPNHCENLDEIGFNVDGAFAQYIVLPARVLWSLEPLADLYKGDDLFLAGSLVEPTSVAYNTVIERGGGVRPGDRVVNLSGGPIGIAACAVLKKAGASKVIISEPQANRAELALSMGADYAINPLKENFVERVLELTDGMGASLFMEATGLPVIVYPDIERVIWEGRTLNSTVVVAARAEANWFNRPGGKPLATSNE